MHPTPTILFLSILLTIESLVGAVAIHNRDSEVYKRAPKAEYKIDAYQDIHCAGFVLGTIKGTSSQALVRAQGANCALVKALSEHFTLILHGKRDNEYPGPLRKGYEIEGSFNSMSVKFL